MSTMSERMANQWPALEVAGWPPHVHSRRYAEHFHLAFSVAALAPLTAGVILYGFSALGTCLLSALSAMTAALLVRLFIHRHAPLSGQRAYWTHAGLIGLLLGLTLPVSAPWYVPVIGGLTAVIVGKELLGGLGNSLWHPALVGRVLVALLYAAQVLPESSPFLAQGHLLYGSCAHAVQVGPDYRGFSLTPAIGHTQAWVMQRPLDVLARHAYPHARQGPDRQQHSVPGNTNSPPSPSTRHPQVSSWVSIFRDQLPPWPDTVWGHVPGGIGATCLPALLLGGLFLIHRGYIRWQLPLATVVTVIVLTSIWPIHVATGAVNHEQITRQWMPLFYTEQGQAVGAAIVLFHVTGPGLWLACLFLATDSVSSPLTRSGQTLAGVSLGAVIVFLRCNPWLPAFPDGEYWAVLLVSTTVPIIDRLAASRLISRRRVYGTK